MALRLELLNANLHNVYTRNSFILSSFNHCSRRWKSDANSDKPSDKVVVTKSTDQSPEPAKDIDEKSPALGEEPPKWVHPSRADKKVIHGEYKLRFSPSEFKKGLKKWWRGRTTYINPFKDPRLHYKRVDWYPDHQTFLEKSNLPRDPKEWLKHPMVHDEFMYKYPHLRHVTGPDFLERLKLEAKWLAEGNITADESRIFPKFVDVLIIGGGVIGASIAHHLLQLNPWKLDVMVIDKDLRFEHSPSRLNIGGIRQQFGLVENVQMSRYCIEFLRNYRREMRAAFYGDDWSPPDLQFHPQGYLIMADENTADILLENHRIQTDEGAYVDILTVDKIKERFPWIGTDGIVIASHGVQDEGWINPWNMYIAFKGCAEFRGARFVECELVDFNIQSIRHLGHEAPDGSVPEEAHYAIVKTPEGHIKEICYTVAVIAAGAQSNTIAQLLKIGDPRVMDERRIPCPIEPRKRYVYQFMADNGPIIDCPVVVDYPERFYCRREGLAGSYLCSRTPHISEEPDITDMSVDNEYFYEKILPIIKKRFPKMKNIRLENSWATYSEHNYWDGLPILGHHPYYFEIMFACGFESCGVQMAPAIGRAVMEEIVYGEYRSIDLSRFDFERIVKRTQLRETGIF